MDTKQNKPELMNLFWTTAGLFPGEGQISHFDFEDRVKAASKAGFQGIGLWHTDLEHCMVHRSLKDMKKILDDNGMKYLELEFLVDWFLDGGRKVESDSRKQLLLTASEALNAKHIKVGDFFNSNLPTEKLAESFRILCDEAANYGATIGFEFMVCSFSGKLKEMIQMIDMAGVKNGGIIIDIVHTVLTGLSLEELKQIPLPQLINVELNDGTLLTNPNHDPSKGRLFCGEGEYDIKGFIKTIRDIGYKGPWAVEVYSQEVAAMTLIDANKSAYETTIAQF